MEIIAGNDEIVLTLNDLNSAIGTGHLIENDQTIKMIFKKQNHFIYLECKSGIYQNTVNATGNLTNQKIYIFSLKKARDFIKALSKHYAEGTGKVLIKLEYERLFVKIPSLTELKLEEDPNNWLGD